MMLVYRISSVQYVQDLSGTGAKINGARWNQVNYPAVYTAENRSLAALEILVHSDMESIMAKKMEIISIEIPDEPSLFIEFEERNLEADWERNELYTQGLGTHLLSNQKILAFKVPSVIIPEEKNIIINPLHAAMDRVRIIGSRPFAFDKRLF